MNKTAPIASADRADLFSILASFKRERNELACTPPGLVIKTHPDGHRELVRHHRDKNEVIRQL